jgi:hypothetical protein
MDVYAYYKGKFYMFRNVGGHGIPHVLYSKIT